MLSALALCLPDASVAATMSPGTSSFSTPTVFAGAHSVAGRKAPLRTLWTARVVDIPTKNSKPRRMAVAEAGVLAVAKLDANGVKTNNAIVRANIAGVR